MEHYLFLFRLRGSIGLLGANVMSRERERQNIERARGQFSQGCAGLANSAMAGRDVAAHLAVLLLACCHLVLLRAKLPLLLNQTRLISSIVFLLHVQ